MKKSQNFDLSDLKGNTKNKAKNKRAGWLGVGWGVVP